MPTLHRECYLLHSDYYYEQVTEKPFTVNEKKEMYVGMAKHFSKNYGNNG